jgi:hypothetical protein
MVRRPLYSQGFHSKFFFCLEQFSKYANLFFLFTACIQQIPGVSPTEPYTTIAPLAVVLMASAFKEIQEDLVSVPSCTVSFFNLWSTEETAPIRY